MSKRNMTAEATDVMRAIALIELGARTQVLEATRIVAGPINPAVS